MGVSTDYVSMFEWLAGWLPDGLNGLNKLNVLIFRNKFKQRTNDEKRYRKFHLIKQFHGVNGV